MHYKGLLWTTGQKWTLCKVVKLRLKLNHNFELNFIIFRWQYHRFCFLKLYYKETLVFLSKFHNLRLPSMSTVGVTVASSPLPESYIKVHPQDAMSKKYKKMLNWFMWNLVIFICCLYGVKLLFCGNIKNKIYYNVW